MVRSAVTSSAKPLSISVARLIAPTSASPTAAVRSVCAPFAAATPSQSQLRSLSTVPRRPPQVLGRRSPSTPPPNPAPNRLILSPASASSIGRFVTSTAHQDLTDEFKVIREALKEPRPKPQSLFKSLAILTVVIVGGVYAGTMMAIYGAAALEQWEIFKYVPEDEEDGEGDSNLRPDYFEINMEMPWSSTHDADRLQYHLDKIDETIEKLDRRYKEHSDATPEDRLVRAEVYAARSYLEKHRSMVQGRLKIVRKG